MSANLTSECQWAGANGQSGSVHCSESARLTIGRAALPRYACSKGPTNFAARKLLSAWSSAIDLLVKGKDAR